MWTHLRCPQSKARSPPPSAQYRPAPWPSAGPPASGVSEKLTERLRLHPETPDQNNVTRDKRPAVRYPKLTWLALITKDLSRTIEDHKIKTPLNKSSLERLKTLAGDIIIWRGEIAKCKTKTT